MSAATARALPTAGKLLHPALLPPQGAPLTGAKLGDRQRLAVVLQAAALLSHLRRAGWRLVGDLTAGWVREGELLCGVSVEAVPSEQWGGPLRGLLAALFAAGGEVGRGGGRRAARELQARWAAELVPLHPDRAVADVLATAPFLWDARFAPSRRSLAAGWARGERVVPWLAGPEAPARRLLARARTLPQLEELLASDEVRALWEGGTGAGGGGGGTAPGPVTPGESSTPGGEDRPRRRRADAVAASPPAASPADPVAGARALVAAGNYADARERLAGGRDVAGRLLAVWCDHQLGRALQTQRALGRLAAERLAAADELALAELAVRIALDDGDVEGAGTWVERAERAAGKRLAWRAALLAGEVAALRGEATTVAAALERSRSALADPRAAWRWYRLQALRSVADGGDGEPLGGLVEALRRCRRDLDRADAALLWDGVAETRLHSGDLVGAEKAAAHAAMLLHGAGSRPRWRVLRRLVEARLRRGRLIGVAEALEQARIGEEAAPAGRPRDAATRPAGDTALRMRLELVRGRPGAALQVAEAALAGAPALTPAEGAARAELLVLAARALGWLGRGDEARQLLAGADLDPARVLEAEEVPALWAHAGERERAVAAAGTVRHLWEAVLAGSHPARGRWSDLEGLEPYRAARLVFDFERITPGLVPVTWVRRSIATLRRLAAGELAAQLEGRLSGPWDALYTHLAESTHDEDGLFRLFAAAGAERAFLAVRTRGGEQVLLPGPGGEEELVAPLGDGHLVLRAPRLDPVVKALFRLLLKQLPAVRAATAGQPVPGVVGESPALLAALARLPRLAAGEVPIIVLGESGTGKELVARQVHRLSRRVDGPFLPINCAALSESLLLEDLFGHAKGAFTGADRDRGGIFEAARGGTVFLDEIGDLPLAAQGKLLRVLQEKEVRRLGESTPRTVDVRVVTATHRDLLTMVREKSFREDLYYRLRVAVVELPPLRERGGDVLLLAEHFLARISRGRRPRRLSRQARERLLAHRWPGNVRELENVLEVASTLADGGIIEREHLLLPESRPAASGTYHQQVETFRRRLVEEALLAAQGNRAEAARRLGLTRQALSYLVRQLGIQER